MAKFLLGLLLVLALTLAVTAEGAPQKWAQGQALVEQKRYDEALEAFKDAYALDASTPAVLYHIGWIYNEQHKYDTAARWLKKAAQLEPNNAKIHHELGFAYAKLRRSKECLKAYTQATLLDPQRLETWTGLGDANFDLLQDYGPAAAAYQQAVDRGCQASGVLYHLGWCYNHLQKFESAQVWLRRAAQQDPTQVPIWIEWGYSLSRLKNYEEASQALTRALLLDPRSALARFYLGRIYLAWNKRDLAEKELDQLRSLDAQLAKQLEQELR